MNYKLNYSDLSKEIFDNEAVIINIPSGKYYSVTGDSGVSVIRLLENSANFDQICIFLSSRFDCSHVNLTEEVRSFLQSLLAEKIAIEVKENQFSMPESKTSLMPFKSMVLEIYDDLQELIDLDPIHDVNISKGWPNKKI